MVTFGGLAGNTNIVSGASECSCWCIPELGNVLPYAIPRDQVCLVNADKLFYDCVHLRYSPLLSMCGTLQSWWFLLAAYYSSTI